MVEGNHCGGSSVTRMGWMVERNHWWWVKCVTDGLDDREKPLVVGQV